MTDISSLRIGVVGLGTIGRIHAERMADLGADLAGADLDVDARQSFEETFDAATYEDHNALLESGVDAVVVGVPNRFHEEVAVDALEVGVDVLLEKPIAHDLESAERIAAAARTADGFCMVGFTMRFASQTERVVELRESGRLGSISHVDGSYLRRDSAPAGGRGWFTDPEMAGGGALVDLGVHVIDLALYMLDYPDVVEVSGVVRSEFGDYEVDDSATALLRCADGQTIGVEASWRATCSSSRTMVVRGTGGGVEFEIGESELTLLDADGETDPEELDVTGEDMHGAEDRMFLDGVAGEHHDLGETVEQGLVVQRILDAIYESSERGEAVRIDH